MNTELINSIAKYVEQHIGEFHRNRIAKLQSVNLKELLSRKNPYLFKAKYSYSWGDGGKFSICNYVISRRKYFWKLDGRCCYVCCRTGVCWL